MELTLDVLKSVVENDAAIRRVQRLQPAGGPGDKIFPPTYPGERNNDPARHVFETRRINGQDVRCVLIDSVQSQANRLEEALLSLLRAGKLKMPHIVVDFSGQKTKLSIQGNGKDAKVSFGKGTEYDLSDIGQITSLETPHRVFDAIIRDSMYNGQRFESTPEFSDLLRAKPTVALPIFAVNPTALLFGVWHSTGQAGGLGAKFARCMVSEIIGVNAKPGRKVSSRIDPLGIQDVPVYEDKEGAPLWTANPDDAKQEKGLLKLFPAPKGKKAGRPSLVNHSNIKPSVSEIRHDVIDDAAGFEFFRDRERRIEFIARYPEAQFDDVKAGGGVTIDYALHTAVISCAGLRRLRFPGNSIKDESAGRTVLAAIALVALTQQDKNGYALRSRCDLVCEKAEPFKVVHPDGTTDDFDLDAIKALTIYNAAVDAAKKAGFPWNETPLRLTPQARLVELVALSRAKALAGELEGAEEN